MYKDAFLLRAKKGENWIWKTGSKEPFFIKLLSKNNNWPLLFPSPLRPRVGCCTLTAMRGKRAQGDTDVVAPLEEAAVSILAV